jgi:hypothetical protein
MAIGPPRSTRIIRAGESLSPRLRQTVPDSYELHGMQKVRGSDVGIFGDPGQVADIAVYGDGPVVAGEQRPGYAPRPAGRCASRAVGPGALEH